MGIHRKIVFGFLTLALLLLFAGLISMAELKRMRSQAEKIIESNNSISLYAKTLQTSLERQNSSVVEMILSNETTPGEEFTAAAAEFSQAVEALESLNNDKLDLSEIKTASEQYLRIINKHLEDVSTMQFYDHQDNLHSEWFLNKYLDIYYRADTAIKNFVSSPKTSISDETNELVRNAARTFTPTIVTLFVAIIIVIIFSNFINIYYVKPIVRINTALKGFINHRIPFSVDIENSGDEISSLNSLIGELTDRIKKLQK